MSEINKNYNQNSDNNNLNVKDNGFEYLPAVTFTTLKDFEERAEKIVRNGFWQDSSPVIVEEYRFIEKKNYRTGEIEKHVAAHYRNISNDTITAIRGFATLLNAFDEDIETWSFEIIDILAKPGEIFGNKHFVRLDNHSVRKINIHIVKIIFENTEKWSLNAEKEKLIPINNIFNDSILINDDLQKFKINLVWNRISPKIKLSNKLVVSDDYWLCHCGALNLISNKNCCQCHAKLIDIKKSITDENIEKIYEQYLHCIDKLKLFLDTERNHIENNRIKNMLTTASSQKKSWPSRKGATS